MDPALLEKASDAGWIRMLHVLGAIAFLGGSLTAARLLGHLVRAEERVRTASAAMARRVYLTLTFPAAILVLGTGIYTLVKDPDGVGYMKQGWFHMKLTVVILILMVDHLLVMRPLKALARGGADPRSSEGLYRAGFWMLGLLSFGLCLSLFVLRK